MDSISELVNMHNCERQRSNSDEPARRTGFASAFALTRFGGLLPGGNRPASEDGSSFHSSQMTAVADAYRTSKTSCYISARMVPYRTKLSCRRVVIDDHARLPGRFFGRFATSATSEL
jgi:hypothetical protein